MPMLSRDAILRRLRNRPSVPPGSPDLRNSYRTRVTPRGFMIVTIDWPAVPERDDAWYQAKLATMGSRAFNREFGRDWTSTSGKLYYPEFAEWDPNMIVAPGQLLRGLPIYRGWDFGYRHPACVWFQYSRPQHRVWVLNEWMPADISTVDFRDMVLCLSGQKSVWELSARGMGELQRLRESDKYPPPPWFPENGFYRFVDYSGPEALKVTATVEGEDAARTDAQVLAEAGITLLPFSVAVKARETIMRTLLRPRPDGFPSILFDPACPILIEGMGGGITYAEGTKINPEPNEPKKDGYYEHLHDALGYGLVNVVPLVAPVPQQQVKTYLTRRETILSSPAQEDLGYYETREPRVIDKRRGR